jgi:hypothetical protein
VLIAKAAKNPSNFRIIDSTIVKASSSSSQARSTIVHSEPFPSRDAAGKPRATPQGRG